MDLSSRSAASSGALDQQIAAADAVPVDGAGGEGGHFAVHGGVDKRGTEEGEHGELRVRHLHLRPEDHLPEEVTEGGGLCGGEVEVEVLAHAHEVRVVEDVALNVQVKGGGGEAVGGVIHFLGEQIIEEPRGIRAGDLEHAAVGTVDDDPAVMGGALLTQRVAVVPGDARGIDHISILGFGGTGSVEERGTVISGGGSHDSDGNPPERA